MAAGNSQSWRGEKESFWPGNITPNPINSPHKDHLLNTPHRIFDPWGLQVLTYSKSLDSSHAAVRTATANTRQSGSFIPGEWTDNHVCGVGERRGRAPPPTVFPAVRMSPRCPCCTLDPGGQQDPTLLRLWMSREAGPGSQGLAMGPPHPRLCERSSLARTRDSQSVAQRGSGSTCELVSSGNSQASPPPPQPPWLGAGPSICALVQPPGIQMRVTIGRITAINDRFLQGAID